MSRSKKGRAGAAPKQGRGGKQGRGQDMASEEGTHFNASFVKRRGRGRGSPSSRGSRHKSERSPCTFLQSSALGDWNSPLSVLPGQSGGGSSESRKRFYWARATRPVNRAVSYVHPEARGTNESLCGTDAGQSGGGSSESRRKFYWARATRPLNRAVAYVYPEARGTNESLQQQEVDDLNSAEVVLPASEGRAAVILDRCPVKPPLFEGSSNSEVLERIVDSSSDMNELCSPSELLVQNKEINQSTIADSEGGLTNSEYVVKKGIKLHAKLASSKKEGKKQVAVNYQKKHRARSMANDGKGGYLCIGGVTIFMDRANDWFEEEDDLVCGGEEEEVPLSRFDRRRRNRMKYKPKFHESPSQSGLSDKSDDLSCSDIDDEIAEDYIAGVEGDFMDVDGLLQTPGVDHGVLVEDMGECTSTSDDSSYSSDDSGIEEVSWHDADFLQALTEEGRDSKAGELNLGNLKLECSSDEDEGTTQQISTKGKVLSKEAARKQIKLLKAGKAFPLQSGQGSTSYKKDKKARGSKKWQRTEMIARKRYERALLRGFDLTTINAKLESIVINNTDLFAFEPMGKTDCLQVQKLASLYRLKSGSQGSGNRRFVMVSRTVQTSLPSGHDKARLEEILRFYKDEDTCGELERGISQKGEGEKRRLVSKARRATCLAFQSMKGGSVLKQDHMQKMHSSSKKAGNRSAKKAENYASQPLSFVSSGIIRSEGEELVMGMANVLTNDRCLEDAQDVPSLGMGSMAQTRARGSLCIGEFEAHTKGFGSRMLAKMGYVDGSGLGKDNQGVAQPLQAIKRPKSLGLGA